MRINRIVPVCCVAISLPLLSAGSASADPTDPNEVVDTCWWDYFSGASFCGGVPCTFNEEFQFDSARDLYGLWPGSPLSSSFDTSGPSSPAQLSDSGGNDCQYWHWAHIKNAGVSQLVINPDSDNRFGYHVDGSQFTDPVSYCPHSETTYVVMGRDPANGPQAYVVGWGQKWGNVGTGPDNSGPCQGYSVANFPCSDTFYCGQDSVTVDTHAYPEIWIGMISWSHDHNHFFGGDPLTNVWWNSTLTYQLIP